MSSIDQQFVEYIVKSLVGNPDAVQIERRIDEKGVLLELTVDPEDLGRVIGKRGATAQSLRTLLRALGTKNDARYNLKIIDNGEERPYQGEQEQRSPAPQQAAVTDDTTSDDDDEVPEAQAVAEDDNNVADLETPEEEETDRDSALSRTRKELQDLDDLDV